MMDHWCNARPFWPIRMFFEKFRLLWRTLDEIHTRSVTLDTNAPCSMLRSKACNILTRGNETVQPNTSTPHTNFIASV